MDSPLLIGAGARRILLAASRDGRLWRMDHRVLHQLLGWLDVREFLPLSLTALARAVFDLPPDTPPTDSQCAMVARALAHLRSWGYVELGTRAQGNQWTYRLHDDPGITLRLSA